MPIRNLSAELQEKSKNELNEVPERIHDDLKHVKVWLKSQPHLHARTDDQWLLSFLRGSKFSLQRTKMKLDMFYTMRKMVPEFFSNRDPLLPEIQEVLKLGVVLPLPETADLAGPRIFLMRCKPGDPSKILLITVIKTALMIADILMNEDDNFVVGGQQLFLDLEGVTLNHVVQVTPNTCRKSLICLQNAYPSRLKGVHVINMSSLFQSAVNIIKSFLSEKLKNRVNLHSKDKLEDFYKTIPLSVLPTEYSGSGDSLDNLTAYWKNKVEDYREWFLEDAKYCSDEKRRPGKPQTVDELFGIEGSFRKLNID